MMIKSAKDFWLFIAAFILVGIGYMKVAGRIIKRIMKR